MSDINKKWNHTQCPLGKLRDRLEDKRRKGTLTSAEKITLNNLTIDFLKDMIKLNKGDTYFIDQMITEIKRIEKENLKNQNEIKEKNERRLKKKEEKPRVKHLRKGPKK